MWDPERQSVFSKVTQIVVMVLGSLLTNLSTYWLVTVSQKCSWWFVVLISLPLLLALPLASFIYFWLLTFIPISIWSYSLSAPSRLCYLGHPLGSGKCYNLSCPVISVPVWPHMGALCSNSSPKPNLDLPAAFLAAAFSTITPMALGRATEALQWQEMFFSLSLMFWLPSWLVISSLEIWWKGLWAGPSWEKNHVKSC